MQQSILKSMFTAFVGFTVSLGIAARANADPIADPIADTVSLGFNVTQPAERATTRATTPASQPVALTFSPNSPNSPTANSTIDDTQPAAASPPLADYSADYPMAILFTGGSTSLVSKAVGSAEGTRTPTGGYTSAYYGHVDPGNGVWNLGSFSYQHGAASPEQADLKQLRRLQQQTLELRRQAQTKSLTLSLLEELNGIDLANQAPLAALDRGYIDWLHLAQQQPMDRAEQIVWARTKAFLDPDTGYWDAPGLGNQWDLIYRDQRRRYDAIARTLSSTSDQAP